MFGALTFAIPFVIGAGVGWAFGFAAAEAVVLGLLFASQTLVAYPVVRRYGLVGNRAVASTVGATVITDTVALAALGVVVGLSSAGWRCRCRHPAHLRAGGPFRLLHLGAATGCPVVLCRARAGAGAPVSCSSWPGSSRRPRWESCSGVESIVGAFFAGLALNRLVPNRGTLMQSIEFVGAALLVPLFLISVGMLVDPAVVADPEP